MFPPSELPIHPAIISFFGLSYASDETRYRYFDEGRFTITEYANRYMNYEWNPLLAEAFHIASSGTDDDVAIAVLKHAIARSPRSAVGHSVLGGLLWKTGRLGQALDHVKMAVGLEPEVQHFRFQLECIGQIYQ